MAICDGYGLTGNSTLTPPMVYVSGSMAVEEVEGVEAAVSPDLWVDEKETKGEGECLVI